MIKPQERYLFPNVTKAMEMKGYSDVTEFATAILEEAKGCPYYRCWIWAPENVRLSYATDLETLRKLFVACINLWKIKERTLVERFDQRFFYKS